MKSSKFTVKNFTYRVTERLKPDDAFAANVAGQILSIGRILHNVDSTGLSQRLLARQRTAIEVEHLHTSVLKKDNPFQSYMYNTLE